MGLSKKRVVVIGGGTGTVSILNGLKQYGDLDISVIVNMTDDGGSQKVIRDEFGMLPFSDIRKSIIALAPEGNGTLRELFTYRFEKGNGLTGHTIGNLIMMALSDIAGSDVYAIDEASRIFGVLGKVIPVTVLDTRLVAEYSDGSIVKGEHLIDEPESFDKKLKIVKLNIDPVVEAYEPAIKAIENADIIISGPGDLYTSIIPNIITGGIPKAIKENTNAKYVYICNLMTKMGQTHWMKGRDFVEEISSYSERTPDFVIFNDQKIPSDILFKYEQNGEYPVEDNFNGEIYKVIRTDLIGEREIQRTKGDKLVRSLVRHDSEKLAQVIYDKIVKV